MQLVRMHLWVRKVFEYYFNILLDLSNNLSRSTMVPSPIL